VNSPCEIKCQITLVGVNSEQDNDDAFAPLESRHNSELRVEGDTKAASCRTRSECMFHTRYIPNPPAAWDKATTERTDNLARVAQKRIYSSFYLKVFNTSYQKRMWRNTSIWENFSLVERIQERTCYCRKISYTDFISTRTEVYILVYVHCNIWQLKWHTSRSQYSD